MTTTPEDRDIIVERLAEIKAEHPSANPEELSPEQVSDVENLDNETTTLLHSLADEKPTPKITRARRPKAHRTFRGDLMRRMADIQAQIDLLRRSERRDDQSHTERQELQRQLAELNRRAE